MLVNKSEIILSQRRAIHNASEIRCHFFEHLSCLEYGLRFTLHNWTFNPYRKLSQILMHQEKILRADLNSGIFSYDQKCHAFLRICRTFEGLTLAPLRPCINL